MPGGFEQQQRICAAEELFVREDAAQTSNDAAASAQKAAKLENDSSLVWQAVSQLQQIAENVNERLGLAASSSVGQRIVGTLSMGGSVGFDAKFVGGKIGLGRRRVAPQQHARDEQIHVQVGRT